MIRLTMPLLLATLTFSATKSRDLYQVISSHPHDVQEFSPYIESIKKEGRLWLVHLKSNTPSKLMKNFRKTDGSDVKSFMPDVSYARLKMLSRSTMDVISKVNIAQIKNDVEVLASFRNRSAGSDDNQKAGNWIADELTSMGYAVSRICYRPGACSVIADKAGEYSPRDVILVMAHFDSVGKSFAGADDNASGTAVLLDMARALKGQANNKTIRFFATNGEELGLLGASHYASQLKGSGEISRIKLAINMDMVGYNSNGVVELETDSKYEGLANWFASLTRQYTALTPKVTIGAWGSDHVPFIKSGVPTLLTIEDWNTKTPCYHMECDRPDTLNYEYAGEIAKLNLAAVMARDKEP